MRLNIPEWICNELNIKGEEKIYFIPNKTSEKNVITKTNDIKEILFISKITRVFQKNTEYYGHYTTKPKKYFYVKELLFQNPVDDDAKIVIMIKQQ
jgi:hypothetical protein